MCAAPRCCSFERGLHLLQFLFASDRAGLDSFEPARGVAEGTGLQTIHGINVNRFALAFDHDRLKSGNFEDTSYQLMCLI